MGHYAFLDNNNVVTEVIVGRDEDEIVNGISDWETYYENIRNQICKRTSYNTIRGKNTRENGIAFRKNYAAIGMIYDENRDAFYYPQPYNSWKLNEETCVWEAPTPRPENTEDVIWVWNEDQQKWSN